MLKKSQRISTNRVAWLLKKGGSINNNFFSAKFYLNKIAESRYSVVVSKKVAPLATDRNTLRRQLYEILRKFPQGNRPTDYLLIAKPLLTSLSFAEKEKAVSETIQQIISKLN